MKTLSTEEIENQIASYSLHFDAVKDYEVEWKIRLPHFIPVFLELVAKYERIPTQTEFTNFYIAKHQDELEALFARWSETERDHKYRALIARLERAYPSFVRDIYLLILLNEHGVAAEYDARFDIESGVDLLVTHNGKRAHLHVFLDSPRALHGRVKKDARHAFTGKHMDVLLKRETCKRVGKFWLPTTEQVEQIKRALE